MDLNTAPQTRRSQVQFTGQTGQFFSIWIVNIVLTVLTLGIYSAWAKVRTHRYFYSNTSIDGHQFTYLANPIQILIGRIIAVVLFAIYVGSVQFVPILGLFIMLIALFLMPWVINRSMRFQHRMTSYRNVRFGFNGSYGEAFLVFIIFPILSVFTLYLLVPWVMKKINSYILNNITYGDRKVEATLSTTDYYVAALLVVAVSIGAMFGFAIVIGIGAAIFGATVDMANLDSAGMSAAAFVIAPITALLYVGMFALITGIYQARIRAHNFANSEIKDVAKFESTITEMQFARLVFFNLIAIGLSLGLAYPWAKIRAARYFANGTFVEIHENADNVIDDMTSDQSAIGEEIAEVFDLDIAIT